MALRGAESIFLCDRHAYDGIRRGGLMSQRVRDVTLLIAAGLFAGSLSGLFGIGGGTVIVPAMPRPQVC